MLTFYISNRDELQKRRRGLMNSQEESNQTPTPGGDIDLQNCSIEQALNYQKANNIDLETFITSIVNKIKFVVSHYFIF